MSRRRRKLSASKKFVLGYLIVLSVCIVSYLVLGFLAVLKDYQGDLYFLQWPVTGLTAAGGVILSPYFSKSKAENTGGGIVYDAAMKGTGDSI